MRFGTDKYFSEESLRLHGTKIPLEVPRRTLLVGLITILDRIKGLQIFDKVTICQQQLV